MSSTNFRTENITYRKLLGNGLNYRIPRFQRDYSWSDEEWEDLWADIVETTRDGGEPAHYMGYLVLQSKDERTFEVIDGQQRLTTLSIIVLAVLRNLQRLVDDKVDPENNAKRMDQIRQSYIGYLDPVTLVARSKLTLNNNNDSYYQSYLVPLRNLPQRGFKASEHAMRKASEWFEKRIREHVKPVAETGSDEGVRLAKLIEAISDRLFFTVITVTDELNAYKVFETLNARGVRLSATDLLKNYLFSVLHREGQHEQEMKSMEERWESLVGRLGGESFPDFLRMHWISRHSLVRQSELFKTIRNQVGDKSKVFSLLKGLEDDMDTYLALVSPDGSNWPIPIKNFARELRMFSVRQPFPLLIAARRVLDDNDFETLIRTLVQISFRYNVIGSQQTSEQERVYSAAAERISGGALLTVRPILDALRPVYLTDKAFIAAFSEKIISTKSSRNQRIVRYVLCKLEHQVSGKDYDFDSDTFNIEHVLPQNPGSNWPLFNDDQAEASVFRIGNMTLLKTSTNRDIQNFSYSEKREVYRASDFQITRKISEENSEWTTERISARQADMARTASGVWRVSQFDQV